MTRNLIKMTWLLTLLLGAGLSFAGDAHAKRKTPERRPTAAPELSGSAGATGAVVLLGAAAMLASRRRRSV
jgi:hypothetical protein